MTVLVDRELLCIRMLLYCNFLGSKLIYYLFPLELVDVYCKHLILAADIAIPRSSGRLLPRKVPWWNEECTLANRQRKQALENTSGHYLC